jgi:hypothetical protein
MRKTAEFYLSYTTVKEEGDKGGGGKVNKQYSIFDYHLTATRLIVHNIMFRKKAR